MNEGGAFTINTAKTISETLNGETIIINLENGNYYSVNSSGSVLWGFIQQGHTHASILQTFLSRYDADHDVIVSALDKTLSFLLNDGLILLVDSPSTTPPTQVFATKEPFVEPMIERYDDMQEMLLADPIHDVDQKGWPNLKQS